ncbi:transposase [Virgibacillus dokdonensis]|uniref:transposase n=1 Tax=Virgibacillus dokdonensis TaxID=302167 RepID=UPI00098A22B5|nr:transposase [Virgibacillus dokdonensis]
MGPYFAFINGFREAISNQDKEELRQLILYEKKRNDPITKGFVTKLLSDFTSNLHACIYKESNGFVEGNVNRLKTIKRMMYGRASFELLRIRVLYPYQ